MGCPGVSSLVCGHEATSIKRTAAVKVIIQACRGGCEKRKCYPEIKVKHTVHGQTSLHSLIWVISNLRWTVSGTPDRQSPNVPSVNLFRALRTQHRHHPYSPRFHRSRFHYCRVHRYRHACPQRFPSPFGDSWVGQRGQRAPVKCHYQRSPRAMVQCFPCFVVDHDQRMANRHPNQTEDWDWAFCWNYLALGLDANTAPGYPHMG